MVWCGGVGVVVWMWQGGVAEGWQWWRGGGRRGTRGSACTPPRRDPHPVQPLPRPTPPPSAVANYNVGTVSVCKVLLGELGTCVSTPGFSSPVGIDIANGIVYVTSVSANLVYVCPILAGGALGTCATSAGNGLFILPSAITIAS